MIKTGNELCAAALRKAFWPAADGDAPLAWSDILAIADQVILGDFYPEVLRTQGDYYLCTLDHDLTADYSRYRLPKRAYAIADVLLVDPDDTGNPEGVSVPFVPREDLGRLPLLGVSRCGFHHFIDGDFVGLSPTPDSTDGRLLRIKYYRVPSALCLTTAARQITGVTSLASGQFAGATLTALWTTSSRLDIVGDGAAHHVLAEGLTPTSVGASTIDFSDDLSGSGIDVDDWLTTRGTTPVIQLPDSMIPPMLERLVEEMLDSQGDRQGAQSASNRAHRLEGKARSASIPRSEAETRTLVTRNSPFRLMR